MRAVRLASVYGPLTVATQGVHPKGHEFDVAGINATAVRARSAPVTKAVSQRLCMAKVIRKFALWDWAILKLIGIAVSFDWSHAVPESAIPFTVQTAEPRPALIRAAAVYLRPEPFLKWAVEGVAVFAPALVMQVAPTAATVRLFTFGNGTDTMSGGHVITFTDGWFRGPLVSAGGSCYFT